MRVFPKRSQAVVDSEQILKQADTCVKCGLCLPHCPTYGLSEDEAESPRGRISLSQGLLQGALEDSPALHGHIDRCLGCGACQAMCPSQVPYMDILDGMRARRNAAMPPLKRKLYPRLLDALSKPSGLFRLLRLYQRSGLQRLLEITPLANRLPAGRLIPELASPSLPHTSANEPADIEIFTGCLGAELDAGAIQALEKILQQLNLTSRRTQGLCCGAMHRHEGFPERADLHLQQLVCSLDAASDTPLLSLASACAASLLDAPEIAPRVAEATTWLADQPLPEDLQARPLQARVLIHIPCTQRNLLKSPDSAEKLLRRIPGIDIRQLPNPSCCGAAGVFMLREPELSQRLFDRQLNDLQQLKPELLVTSNTGCALQWRSGLKQAGLDIEVLHPVELFARQLVER